MKLYNCDLKSRIAWIKTRFNEQLRLPIYSGKDHLELWPIMSKIKKKSKTLLEFFFNKLVNSKRLICQNQVVLLTPQAQIRNKNDQIDLDIDGKLNKGQTWSGLPIVIGILTQRSKVVEPYSERITFGDHWTNIQQFG